MLYVIVVILSTNVFFAVYGVVSCFEDAWRGLRGIRRRRAVR